MRKQNSELFAVPHQDSHIEKLLEGSAPVVRELLFNNTLTRLDWGKIRYCGRHVKWMVCVAKMEGVVVGVTLVRVSERCAGADLCSSVLVVEPVMSF